MTASEKTTAEGMVSSSNRAQINPQTIARVTGVLFLITFITAIPAFFFYVPVLDDPRYIVGSGADTSVSSGVFLELLLIIANIGTAVVLGVIEAGSAWQSIAAIPEFFWELSLGIWLIVKEFNPSAAILSEPDTKDLNGRETS